MDLLHNNLELINKKNPFYLKGIEELTGFKVEHFEEIYNNYMVSNQLKQWVSELWDTQQKEYEFIECFDVFYGKIIGIFENKIHSELFKYAAIISNEEKVLEKCCHYFYTRIKPLLTRTLVLEVNQYEKETPLIGSKKRTYVQWEKSLIIKENFFDYFLTKYPELTQHLNEEFLETIAIIKNIFKRMLKDYSEISNYFNLEGKIKDIDWGLGDPHEKDEAVVVFHFDKNKVVYKPKNAKINYCIEQLLNKISEKNSRIQLFVPRYLDKITYNWTMYCQSGKLITKEDKRNFHYNMGALSAILYVFNAHDMHRSNLVVQKGKLFLIDLECFFSNINFDFSDNKSDFFRKTILGSHLIPGLSGNKENIYQTGLYKSMNEEVIQVLQNTYQSNVKLSRIKIKKESKLDNPYEPEMEKEVIQGFEQCYDLILEERDNLIEIVKKNSNNLELRILIRNSLDYGKLIYYGFHPRFLKNKLDRDLFLTLLYNENVPVDIQKLEYEKILNRKIPLFHISMTDKTIKISDKSITGHSFETALNQLNNKIKQLSLDDKKKQLYLLKKSLNSFKEEKIEDEVMKEKKLSTKEIFEFILNNLEPVKTNYFYNIITFDHSPLIQQMNGSLYHGIGGLAFILLCMFKINKEIYWLDLSEKMYKKIIVQYNQDSKNDIGVLTGIGSKAYLAFLLYKETNKISYYNDYLNYVIFINQNIEEIEMLDFISGLSGALVFLINSNKDKNSELVTKTINKIVQKLNKRKHNLNDDTVAWEKNLTGFSHGNSGIIYALTLYNNENPDIHMIKLIESALKFEKKFRYHSGWFDLRTSVKKKDVNAWCHGAPGILLCREEMLKSKFLNEAILDIVKEDIAMIQENKEKFYESQSYSLCHGLSGNFICGGFPDHLVDRLNNYLLYAIGKMKQHENVDYSLMLGVSGVIYSLMYQEHQELPNLLVLDT